MGLILMFGIVMDLIGIGWLIGSVTFLVLGIKNKKTQMYILSVVALVLSLIILGIGIYFTYGTLQYAGVF